MRPPKLAKLGHAHGLWKVFGGSGSGGAGVQRPLRVPGKAARSP